MIPAQRSVLRMVVLSDGCGAPEDVESLIEAITQDVEQPRWGSPPGRQATSVRAPAR